MALRIGQGYDIHAKKDGRVLTLGGIVFEGERGLDGHSDADVLLHAIGDALLDGHGAKIVNVDATVIAELPKIQKRRDEMRLAIAQALRVGAKQVSVKATTHERLGAVGRDEGIAAFAIAMVDLT